MPPYCRTRLQKAVHPLPGFEIIPLRTVQAHVWALNSVLLYLTNQSSQAVTLALKPGCGYSSRNLVVCPWQCHDLPGIVHVHGGAVPPDGRDVHAGLRELTGPGHDLRRSAAVLSRRQPSAAWRAGALPTNGGTTGAKFSCLQPAAHTWVGDTTCWGGSIRSGTSSSWQPSIIS